MSWTLEGMLDLSIVTRQCRQYPFDKIHNSVVPQNCDV